MKAVEIGMCALAWLAVSSTAMAQSYVPIEQRLDAAQLREVGLSDAQLHLLDRMLRDAHEKQAPLRAEVVAPVQPDDTGHGSSASPSDAPIISRVAGAVSGWEPGTVFELHNGQQWRVLKGSMRLREPLESPDIVVVPGVAGRWFLQVDPDMPKARVYRID